MKNGERERENKNYILLRFWAGSSGGCLPTYPHWDAYTPSTGGERGWVCSTQDRGETWVQRRCCGRCSGGGGEEAREGEERGCGGWEKYGGDAMAYLDKVLSDLLALVHGVKGCDLVGADLGHAEDLGDVVHGTEGEPSAALALGKVEQRHDGTLLVPLRVLCNDLAHLFLVLLVKGKVGVLVVVPARVLVRRKPSCRPSKRSSSLRNLKCLLQRPQH